MINPWDITSASKILYLEAFLKSEFVYPAYIHLFVQGSAVTCFASIHHQVLRLLSYYYHRRQRAKLDSRGFTEKNEAWVSIVGTQLTCMDVNKTSRVIFATLFHVLWIFRTYFGILLLHFHVGKKPGRRRKRQQLSSCSETWLGFVVPGEAWTKGREPQIMHSMHFRHHCSLLSLSVLKQDYSDLVKEDENSSSSVFTWKKGVEKGSNTPSHSSDPGSLCCYKLLSPNLIVLQFKWAHVGKHRGNGKAASCLYFIAGWFIYGSSARQRL